MSMAGDLLNEQKQEKLFAILLKRDENMVCADCHSKAPTWVSLDFGVFVCMNCSGAHRHLSRSVTRVYSTKIDRWNHQNYQIMDYIGNGIANQYWEFKKPTRRIALNAQPDERVRFVTEKYVRKLYTNPKATNPVITFLKNREKGILERPVLNGEEQHLQIPPINIDGKKQYISNGAATNEHNVQLCKEQKEIGKKEFNSVTSPSSKPMADLLDLDDDNYKLDNEDKFTNFMTAPQGATTITQTTTQQTQQKPQVNVNGPSIYDLYNTKQNSAPNTSSTQGTTTGSNLNALYQNGTSLYQQNSYPNYGNTNSYPQSHSHQNQHQHQPHHYNTNNLNNLNKPTQHFGTGASQQTNTATTANTQQQTQSSKPVDLMSLYNQNNPTQNKNVVNPPQIIQPPQVQVQNNADVVVDKNRYQALNQMGQGGQYANYYPYYQMQQGYQNYNYQNQWKQQ